jgi:hypothetical protein
MSKPEWNLVLLTTKSFSKVRKAYVSAITIFSVIIFSVAGLYGLGRLVWFTTSLGIAKFGVYQARRDNEGLLLKIQFLKKFILKEEQRIRSLVDFEDRVRLQYGLEPISNDVRMAGIGGKPSSQDMIIATLLDPVLVHAESVKESVESLLRRAQLQDSTLTHMSKKVSSIQNYWNQRPSIWPTKGRITSPFGYRFHPIEGQNMFHEGLDIANVHQTPIHATADGVVRFAGNRDFYGKAIIVSHEQAEMETVYAHLDRILIKNGQHVKRGEVIALMGSTGRSTGPHLHYEVRVNGRHMNPMSFILPEDVIVD